MESERGQTQTSVDEKRCVVVVERTNCWREKERKREKNSEAACMVRVVVRTFHFVYLRVLIHTVSNSSTRTFTHVLPSRAGPGAPRHCFYYFGIQKKKRRRFVPTDPSEEVLFSFFHNPPILCCVTIPPVIHRIPYLPLLLSSFVPACLFCSILFSLLQSIITIKMKLDLSHLSKQNYTPHPATPIQPMPQLTKAVCGDNSTENTMLYIKRDDLLMGLCGGGNKVRKLEYAMAAALEAGADTIVTCGAVQSNHCRLTLAACIREGLQCSLVVEERVPGSYHPEASGNHYLFQLLGAEHIRRVGLGEAQDEIQVLKKELEAQGRKVYVIPGGASNALGTTGYVSCANEIMVRTLKKCVCL